MLVSQFLLATVKETPADAEIISHRLMLRAGMIRKLASGLYTWLPLGLRVLHKVSTIVREEMNKAGALELMMPAVQPAELWQESQRWQAYGPELLRIQDRHERDFCFGPTHEEVITDLMRRELKSYKQLPLNLYQIQTKFRDEIRPRFGVMRAREFLMKDAYSFHLNQRSLDDTYQLMLRCYGAIFDRLGLKYRAVLADSGAIGGNLSHEFQVLAESGEDCIVYSDQGGYAANVERAEALAPTHTRAAPQHAMESFATPQVKTIQDLQDLHHLSPQQTIKTLIVKGQDEPYVALILRGDHELNPLKAEKLPAVMAPLTFASEAEVQQALGCRPGSLGPVSLPIPCIVDRDAALLSDFVCGANQEHVHLKNVNWERDVSLPPVADLRNVVAGDLSPDGKGKLLFARGIEVGHVFQLGDKYSRAMDLTVLDEQGKSVLVQMGCYGIGVSRIVAAAIEQNHDKDGIVWPQAMAPFSVALCPIQMNKSYRVRECVQELYEAMQSAGIEVLLDDRNERPGVMFSDMDLIGIPHRLVISERGIDAGTVEYKARHAHDLEHWPLQEVMQRLKVIFSDASASVIG